jgi:hypothetical protein
LSAGTVDVTGVAIVVVDAEEIVLVARNAADPASEAQCSNRGVSDKPVCHVEVVKMLLDDVVA